MSDPPCVCSSLALAVASCLPPAAAPISFHPSLSSAMSSPAGRTSARDRRAPESFAPMISATPTSAKKAQATTSPTGARSPKAKKKENKPAPKKKKPEQKEPTEEEEEAADKEESADGQAAASDAEASDSGSDVEYVVESIVAVKKSGRSRLFKVRWQGFKPSDDTWSVGSDRARACTGTGILPPARDSHLSSFTSRVYLFLRCPSFGAQGAGGQCERHPGVQGL